MDNLKSNFSEENSFDPFIETLIDRFQLRNLPEEELNDFKNNMEQQISRRLGLVILENLNEAGLKEYEEALSEILIPDPEKIKEITQKYIPDLGDKVKVALENFIREIEQTFSK